MSERKRKAEKQSQGRRKKSTSGSFFKEDVISFYSLPPELIMQILTVGHIDKETLEAMRRTNKQLYSIITDPASKKIICRELRESLSRLRTPDGILGWLNRNQIEWESRNGEDSFLFFKEEDGSTGTLRYRHHHPDDEDHAGILRGFISTRYLNKEWGMISDYKQTLGLLYSTYGIPVDLQPSEMTTKQILDRPEYKKAKSDFEKKELKPVLQEMLDRGVRFGTNLIQREPQVKGALKKKLARATPASEGDREYWFVPSSVDKRYRLYSKGSRLQDDTARDHPYCRDVIPASNT